MSSVLQAVMHENTNLPKGSSTECPACMHIGLLPASLPVFAMQTYLGAPVYCAADVEDSYNPLSMNKTGLYTYQQCTQKGPTP